MVEEILGAHPVDDNFWDNTNPTDVSIDTVNSEEKMTGSHITEFHTHEDQQPVIADLLCQKDRKYDDWHDQQLMTHEPDTGRGYHNPSDPQSNTSVDYKLTTGKN